MVEVKGKTPSDAELKKMLTPEDYKLLTQAKAQQERKDKGKKAVEIANDMCNKEDGKYFAEYTKHNNAAQAIYDKALLEARKDVGLVDEQKE